MQNAFKEISERFKEVADRFQQMDGRFDKTDERLDRLERKVDTLELKVDHQRTEIGNIYKLFGAVGSEINDIHHTTNSTQKTVLQAVLELKTTMLDVAERVGRVNTDIIRMRTADTERFANLDDRVTKVEKLLDELRKKS